MTLDQIQSKLDVLRENLAQLDRVPQSSLGEFEADFRNVSATLYLLQTAIQALIDIASFLVARRGLATPRTSHETFERLEEAGMLPAGAATRAAPIVGFRYGSCTSTTAWTRRASTRSWSDIEATWWTCSTSCSPRSKRTTGSAAIHRARAASHATPPLPRTLA